MIPQVCLLAEVGAVQFALFPLVVYHRLLNARGVGGMPTATGWSFRRRRDAKDGRSGLGDYWAALAQAPVQNRPTVCSDVILLVTSSCWYNSGQIKQLVAH